MRIVFYLFCLAGLAFTSCESTSSYQLPTVPDEFINFTIDGQDITLNAIEGTGQRNNYVTFYSDGNNNINLSRTSPDKTTKMRISGINLPLVKSGDELSYVGSAYSPVTITVSGNSMSGSIYCPHVEDAQSVTYEGLLRIEEITKAGIMTGAFKSSPGVEGNVVEVENGTFQLGVIIND